ncbi:ABC transporter permease [Zavarzinia aquatilis]|uniref:ABC transporter permease n=1 Tax=Zavarzinia aquatilis TaxID=2211142 RepID=A0A317DXM1_9PROT|nr:ABC transporter permease [Zavarzinia aquatilis]PWR19478.1 ABC transporter permease [Zavarzinia aquatilis]
MASLDLGAAKETRPMRRDKPRRLPRALTTVFWFALAWGLLIGLWELGTAQGFLNDRILPPPSETIPFLLSGGANVGFGVQKAGLIDAVVVTLGRIAIGLSCGLGLAVLVGALIVEFVPARRLFMPIVQTIAPISPVAWIPFAIAIVGIGDPAAIFVVFMAIFGSMAVAAVAAFDAVPGEYVKVATTLGAGRLRIWFRVLLPGALPGIMTMTRMSLFGAWMAVLAGEMAGINSGLGYLIMMGQQMYNMKLVMSGIITIGAIGFLLDRVMLLIQHRVLWWERRT